MKQNWVKTIILFIAGQTISLFGSMLVQYSISWYITMNTKSGVMMMVSFRTCKGVKKATGAIRIRKQALNRQNVRMNLL